MAGSARPNERLDWLGAETINRLSARSAAASARARHTGRATLAVVCQRLEGALDPAAVVLLGRTTNEDWGILEQPDSGAASLVTLGCAARIEAEGSERFIDVSQRWRNLATEAIADAPGGPRASGAVAFGGFSFDGKTRAAGPWRGFSGASMIVPKLAFARQDGETWITLQLLIAGETDPELAVNELLERLGQLDRSAVLPDVASFASMSPIVGSALPAEHYEAAVSSTLAAISSGRVQKAVLAREVLVERGEDHEPGPVLSVLREVFPSCFLFAVGRGDATFIGASPELLIRREGLQAATVALAGSTARSADPAVDDHLGERLMRSAKDRSEQQIVTQRVIANLESRSVWVTAADEPQLVKVANVQHLATPIRARLKQPVAAVELAGSLHPTPAVGGEPWPEAGQLIAEVEGLDRGWYASPIGWTDGNENGEFIVALRCALLRGSEARCYAGVGVVAGSNPADELAETELKLQALLPIVSV